MCLILLCKTQNFIHLFHPYYAELCFQALNQTSKERYKFDKKACPLCRNVSEMLEHYSRLLVIEKALWRLSKSEYHCVFMKNVSYITFLVDPLTFWVQLKLSLSTSWNHFQFFYLFFYFTYKHGKISKQLHLLLRFV